MKDHKPHTSPKYFVRYNLSFPRKACTFPHAVEEVSLREKDQRTQCGVDIFVTFSSWFWGSQVGEFSAEIADRQMLHKVHEPCSSQPNGINGTDLTGMPQL